MIANTIIRTINKPIRMTRSCGPNTSGWPSTDAVDNNVNRPIVDKQLQPIANLDNALSTFNSSKIKNTY
jgi:hypothetical protein